MSKVSLCWRATAAISRSYSASIRPAERSSRNSSANSVAVSSSVGHRRKIAGTPGAGPGSGGNACSAVYPLGTRSGPVDKSQIDHRHVKPHQRAAARSGGGPDRPTNGSCPGDNGSRSATNLVQGVAAQAVQFRQRRADPFTLLWLQLDGPSAARTARRCSSSGTGSSGVRGTIFTSWPSHASGMGS